VILFLFFDADYLTAFIMAAVRANNMRQAHLAAVAALDEVVRLETVMSAAAVTAAFGQFPFWVGRHGLTPGYDLKNLPGRAYNGLLIPGHPHPRGCAILTHEGLPWGAGRGKLYGHVVEMSRSFSRKNSYSQPVRVLTG
jgi:hypothetical protein